MDWTQIISEIGGGLPAVVIAGLAFWVWSQAKRIEVLTDRIIDMSRQQTDAMNELTRAIERGGKRNAE